MAVSRVRLSERGPEISRIVYGCWRLLEDPEGADPQRVLARIEACLEVGVTSFDHADIYGGYGCEKAFGAAVKLKPALCDRIQIITKCDIALVAAARPHHRLKHYDTSREQIVRCAEASLRNLGVEVIDVLLLHRPDPLMDADETAAALTQLVEQGKVRRLGVSNFMPWQFDLLQSRLDAPLVTNQVELSVLALDALHDGTLDQCQRLRIRPMAWSSMGGGKLFSGTADRERRVRAALQAVASKQGAGLDQVALAWLMRHPSGPTPIVGTNRIERIRSAAEAERIEMDRQDWFSIWEASAGREVP